MLTLSKTHLSKIQVHAIDCYPEECCGAMFGTIQDGGESKVITEIEPIDNTSSENKKRRFMITPEEYQRVESKASKLGVTLLGFYHSHPDHPAQPSQTDLNYAWPFFSYIILAIKDRVAKEINSFVLDMDSGKFKEEPIKEQ